MKVTLEDENILVFETSGLRIEATPGDTDLEFTDEALQFMASAYCDEQLTKYVIDVLTGDTRWYAGDDDMREYFDERMGIMRESDLDSTFQAGARKVVRLTKRQVEWNLQDLRYGTSGEWFTKSDDFKAGVAAALDVLNSVKVKR